MANTAGFVWVRPIGVYGSAAAPVRIPNTRCTNKSVFFAIFPQIRLTDSGN